MLRVSVHGKCYVPEERVIANAAHALTLGLPLIEGLPAADEGPLALVGGGPSTALHLDELRAWKGRVWGINGTHQWLRSHGIEASLFSVDPGEELADLTAGAKTAVLASHCDPQVFANLQGAQVVIFNSEHVAGAKRPLIGGTTSATRAPMVALMLGHSEVHFFGCEGSFSDSSHTYKSESHPKQLIIRAGGQDYRTTLQFMVQSENLAHLISRLPMLKDRSSGLLGAMIEHPDTWEIVAYSGALRDEIDPTAAVLYEMN